MAIRNYKIFALSFNWADAFHYSNSSFCTSCHSFEYSFFSLIAPKWLFVLPAFVFASSYGLKLELKLVHSSGMIWRRWFPSLMSLKLIRMEWVKPEKIHSFTSCVMNGKINYTHFRACFIFSTFLFFLARLLLAQSLSSRGKPSDQSRISPISESTVLQRHWRDAQRWRESAKAEECGFQGKIVHRNSTKHRRGGEGGRCVRKEAEKKQNLNWRRNLLYVLSTN